MDDQALMQTYGNTDLPEGTAKRPLVTFALFAYNQEKYIREAIEGALSQTYSPLEIILSDDCSKDRTYEIMKAMAEQYSGPHTLRVARTPENLGVVNHVFFRVRQAKGEIVVVAAGDDISHPERCEKHVDVYNDTSVYGVTTGYDLIDEQGTVLATHVTEPVIKSSYDQQIQFFNTLQYPYVVIQGSTASYRRRLFDVELPAKRHSFAEDNLLNFMIYAQGYRVARIEQSLVKYRTHDAALANRKISHKDLSSEECAIRYAACDQRNKMEIFIDIAGNMKDSRTINFDRLRLQMEKAKIQSDWPNLGFLSRSYSSLKSFLAGDIAAARWKLARIAGRFPHYQPRRVLKSFRRLSRR